MADILPWSFRSALEVSLRIVGVNELQRRQVVFNGADGFDLTEWMPPDEKWKAYRQRFHDLEKLDTIVVHITAVRGGYGVSRRRVAFWEQVLMGTKKPPSRFPVELLEVLPLGTLKDQASRLALWERYRNAPYHQIGAGNGDSIANHSLRRYSWHAGKGNFGVGWALDAGPNQALDSWMVDTGQASLATLAHRIDPTYQRPIRVVPHRCFTSGRVRDTNPTVWREVVKPVVEQTPNLWIDYEMRRGTGRPVPRSWDPDAVFDDRGRKIIDLGRAAA